MEHKGCGCVEMLSGDSGGIRSRVGLLVSHCLFSLNVFFLAQFY